MPSTSSTAHGAPQVDFVDARIGLHLVEGALGQHLAVVQHGDAVGERAHHVHVVLDDEQRHLARQRLEHAASCAASPRATCRRWARRGAGAAGAVASATPDLELALLAVGQARRPARRGARRGPPPRPPPAPARAAPAARVDRCRADRSCRAPTGGGGQPQVLQHGELREEVRALERARDAAAGHRVRRQARDRRARRRGCARASGASWPVMRLKSVVLPAPLGPMMARRSRGATASDTPLSAASAPKRAAEPVDGEERATAVTRGAPRGRAARPRCRRGRRARTG